jgi:hypothetical protein
LTWGESGNRIVVHLPAVVTCPNPAAETTSDCEASTPVPLTAGKYVNRVSCASGVGLPPLLNGLMI